MPIKPKEWLERRYELLRKEFGYAEFSGDDAKKTLTGKSKDDEKSIPVILSELKKQGWIEAKLDPIDSRKRMYKLKSQEEIIKETLSLDKEVLTRQDIERILKAAADLIRTRVDYKFILILLFLKRISDKWEEEFQEAIKEAKEEYRLSDEEAQEEAKKAAYHDFDLLKECQWESLRKEVSELPEKFSKALKKIAESNNELRDIFDNADFIQFASNPENSEILRQLVELFSQKKLSHVSPDILGDAYEWILRYFAPQKAKEGEVYTPTEVIQLIIEILKPKSEESVYDPASGADRMLIEAYKYVKDKEGPESAAKLLLYGQEANQKTLALGRMNMYIHNIRDVQLGLGDTLLYPKFKEENDIKQFDIVIANPPWNQDGYDENVLKRGEFWKKRFSYGFTPKQSADWAWIQHMLASANDKTGRVGVVMDNGCLFRGGKENAIRQRIVENDLLEALILLPEKLFYNTGAPGAILIFRKDKSEKRKNKVLFINASQEFEKNPDVKKLNILTEQNIKRIVEAYGEFKSIDGFYRVVELHEIKNNNFNLNVPIYVFPEEEVEDINVWKEWQEEKELKKQEEKIDEKIEVYLKEIK